eukprot:305394_1
MMAVSCQVSDALSVVIPTMSDNNMLPIAQNKSTINLHHGHNSIELRLSTKNILSDLFAVYFSFYLQHPILIVNVISTRDHGFYTKYKMITKDMFNTIVTTVLSIIDDAIAVGLELIGSDLNIDITDTLDVMNAQDADKNAMERRKEITNLCDEIQFGDDTYEDGHDLDVQIVSIHNRANRNNNCRDEIERKKHFASYIFGSYKLTKQIMDNLIRMMHACDDLDTACPCIQYSRGVAICATDEVLESSLIQCVGCSIKYHVLCLNMVTTHQSKHMGENMICGICNGMKQFNLVEWIKGNRVRPDMDMVTETMLMFAEQNNRIIGGACGLYPRSDMNTLIQSIAFLYHTSIIHKSYSSFEQFSIGFVFGLVADNMRNRALYEIPDEIVSVLQEFKPLNITNLLKELGVGFIAIDKASRKVVHWIPDDYKQELNDCILIIQNHCIADLLVQTSYYGKQYTLVAFAKGQQFYLIKNHRIVLIDNEIITIRIDTNERGTIDDVSFSIWLMNKPNDVEMAANDIAIVNTNQNEHNQKGRKTIKRKGFFSDPNARKRLKQ